MRFQVDFGAGRLDLAVREAVDFFAETLAFFFGAGLRLDAVVLRFDAVLLRLLWVTLSTMRAVDLPIDF